MNELLQQVVANALTFLDAITRERTRPRDAQQRLRELQARHAPVSLELVWEEEPYDGSVHYDVLVRADDTTVSVSLCRDDALPWPLRGVRRWSDFELAQVNRQILTMEQGVAFLDFVWDQAPIVNRMIDACLMREELERAPIDIDDAALQVGLDAFRRKKQLYTADDTLRWMQAQGMTHEHLENLVTETLTYRKLRERIVAGRIEAYFERHHADFDTARIARIACGDEATAQRLHRDVRGGELDFFEAAARHYLATAEPERGFFSTLRRRDAAALADPVFASSAGGLVGPVAIDDTFVVARVLSITPAVLDAATRAAIDDILVEEWLDERRRTAKILWYWGKADRATQPA